MCYFEPTFLVSTGGARGAYNPFNSVAGEQDRLRVSDRPMVEKAMRIDVIFSVHRWQSW